MAQGTTPITVVGNLVQDFEARSVGDQNTPVANGRIATNPRKFDSAQNQWVDDEPLFLDLAVWRDQARNAYDSLGKGDRVIVTGTLRQRSFEMQDGTKRTAYVVDVEEIGPSLKFATAQVQKTPRSGQGGGYGANNAPQGNYGGYGGNGPQNGAQGGYAQGNQGGFPEGDPTPWQ